MNKCLSVSAPISSIACVHFISICNYIIHLYVCKYFYQPLYVYNINIYIKVKIKIIINIYISIYVSIYVSIYISIYISISNSINIKISLIFTLSLKLTLRLSLTFTFHRPKYITESASISLENDLKKSTTKNKKHVH